MIVEVRSYRIKPGRRAEFIQFFETRSVPALRSYGMTVLGPLLDLENPNKFVWLRSFPSLEDRERMRNAFYEGALWKDELEAIAMPMLESYDVILCETSSGCVFDVPGPCESDRLAH
jgi:NIPSNAP protein